MDAEGFSMDPFNATKAGTEVLLCVLTSNFVIFGSINSFSKKKSLSKPSLLEWLQYFDVCEFLFFVKPVSNCSCRIVTAMFDCSQSVCLLLSR
jgi:hypothetical protein